jgi:hypothetical protein
VTLKVTHRVVDGVTARKKAAADRCGVSERKGWKGENSE